MDYRRYTAALVTGAIATSVITAATDARAHYEPCKISAGKDSCPKAETCSRDDGTTGICLPPPCDADVDCKIAPLLKCDKRQVPPFCIECYSNSDCVAPLTCELDVRNPLSYRCVECGPGHVEACVGSDAGHACVFEQGVCGCIDTPDCPSGTFCRRGACIPRPAGSSDGSLIEDSDAAANDAGADASINATGGSTGGGSGCVAASESERDWPVISAAFASIAALAIAFRRRSRRRS